MSVSRRRGVVIRTHPVAQFLRLQAAGQQLLPDLDETLAKHGRRSDVNHRVCLLE